MSEPAPARLPMPLGQGVTFARLLQQARRLQMHHAVLIEGQQGAGKSTIADWLAAALLCRSELDPDTPCGICRDCRRVAAGQHPDVHVIARAADEQQVEEFGGSVHVIRIDQVRAVQVALGRAAVEGRARVVVIRDAHTMEEETQNALLKTLEEPGPDTFLVVETARPEQMLPTIRSRAQRLGVRPLDDAPLRAELRRRLPTAGNLQERAIALAGGSLGRALQVCTEQAVRLHDLVSAMLAGNNPLRAVATARAALEGATGRTQAVAQARLFLALLAAELRLRLQRHLADADAGAYVAGHPEPWATLLEHTLAAHQDLDLRIPPDQVLTACLLQCDAAP